MGDTVYVITSGGYDSYLVHAVVRGKKRAVDMLAARASSETYRGGYRIETLPVVDADVTPLQLTQICQDIWDDGTSGEETVTVRAEWPFDLVQPQQNVPAGWRWVRAPCHEGKGGRLEVYGTDAVLVEALFDDMKAALQSDDVLRGRRERTGTARP